MSKEVIDSNDKIENQHSPDQPTTKTEKSQQKPKTDDTYMAFVCKCVADQFVKYGGKYYHVDSLGCPLSEDDAQHVAIQYIRNTFQEQSKQPEQVKTILGRVFGSNTDDPNQTIALWGKGTRCAPGNHHRVIRGEYMASINKWTEPEYRTLGVKDTDDGMLDKFLTLTIVHPSDKILFLDWLSWCLQNEKKKPGFAPLLYSREKGTGKSTLCRFTALLFGEANALSMNGVSQITGRFNKPLLDSKLLILEELKLKPTSNQGNALKALITEEYASAERKGVDIEKAKQCCCFIFTTNHLPQWIEGNDRRFHVIDMGHDGHASGHDAEEFSKFMTEFYGWMEKPENIAKAYKVSTAA
jgi:hypothetical protein